MDRRSSLIDQVPTPSRVSEDVFADEFEVDEFDGVADGFRSGDTGMETEEELDDRYGGGQDVPLRSISAHYAPDTTSHAAPAPQTRDSTRKSGSFENPFASREDEEGEPMLSFEPSHYAHRSVSSASSHVFARTGSQRMTSGPSHPYGMYPQGTLARMESAATSSTMRAPQSRSANLQGGPQHPYALYPQGVEEDDDEEHSPHNPVPVGFPGLGHGFNRQRGPDGEEQDIVGADGHAEQLPPYSRYPEDGPEKMPLLGVPVAPTPLHSRAPVAGTDPGMPLMHQTLQPSISAQPESMSDETTLLRQESRRSTARSITASGSYASKKSWNEKSWKEKRKTKFCGIPVWCYILAACVTGFIAVVLGGVIGGFVMGAHKHKDQLMDPTQGSSLYDVSTIATPTAAQTPKTGTFALSLSTPQATQASCLPSSDQQAAWSCDLGDAPGVAIIVGWNETCNKLGASLSYASNSTQTSYGSQLSWMQTNFAPFITVQDDDSPSSGPAYYFRTLYDKLVVLDESAFSADDANNDKAKRQTFHLDTSWVTQKTVAKPGDKPWFCVWNNTFLEGFVYVEQTPNPTFTMSTSSSSTYASASKSSYASSTTSPTAGPGYPYDGTYTKTVSNEYTTTTSTGYAVPHPPWSSESSYYDSQEDDYAHYQSQTTNSKRQNDGDLYESLALYPYVVKIAERRISGNTVKPYCQQYQILDDYEYGPVYINGDPVVIMLTEDDPSYSAYQSADAASTRKMFNKRLVDGECHCQWISGQECARLAFERYGWECLGAGNNKEAHLYDIYDPSAHVRCKWLVNVFKVVMCEDTPPHLNREVLNCILLDSTRSCASCIKCEDCQLRKIHVHRNHRISDRPRWPLYTAGTARLALARQRLLPASAIFHLLSSHGFGSPVERTKPDDFGVRPNFHLHYIHRLPTLQTSL
nr:hypothetical protein CFP56_20263 [Quercus suber]